MIINNPFDRFLALLLLLTILFCVSLYVYDPYMHTSQVSSCNVGDKSARSENLYCRFQDITLRIKNEAGLIDESSTLYFQKVWKPARQKDSTSFVSELGKGEFISSEREIKIFYPTISFQSGTLPTDIDVPETIMFVKEEKKSDTLFYYVEYTQRLDQMEHVLYPIAYLTPEGEVRECTDEYIISEEFLKKKISDFINEIDYLYVGSMKE